MLKLRFTRKPIAAAANPEPTAIELQDTNAPIASGSSLSPAIAHTPPFSRQDAALAAFQGVISGAQAILQAANEPIASSVLASISQIIKLAGVSAPFVSFINWFNELQ